MPPWEASDAVRHTRKAKSAVSKRQWSDVADSVLKRTGDEGRAIRIANGVVKNRGKSDNKHAKRSGGKHG